jgi:hypothetical protein
MIPAVVRVVVPVPAPGVVDDVGGFGRIGVVPLPVGGRDHPLAGLQDRFHAGAVVVGGDPLGAGCDADLVARAVVADHGAHGVGAVVAEVARRAAATALDVVEVVVVGEGAVAVVAAVLLHECGMVVLDAGVDAGDHDAFAGDAELIPDAGGVDVLDAPNGGGRGEVGLGRFDRFDGIHSGRVADHGDLVECGDSLEQVDAAGHFDGR